MAKGIHLRGTLSNRINPELDKINSGLDKTKKGTQKASSESSKAAGKWKKNFQGMEKDVQGVTKSLGGMKTMIPAALGAAGILGSMGAITKSGLSFNAGLESITTQFRVILGDADKTKQVMADIVKFSAETPFQLQEVAKAGKMLTAFGLGGIENLKLVGDAAAAAGRPIEEIAMTFGRIKSGAFGEAFMRLAETGLATKDMLKAEGLEFDKGGGFVGSADQAMKAVKKIVSERYGGMMEEMSGTWSGAMSTMKDNWGLFSGALTKPLFERLKPRIKAVTETLVKFTSSKAVMEWADRAGEAIDSFIDRTITTIKWLQEWGPTLVQIGIGLGVVIGSVTLMSKAVLLWSQRQAILNAIMAVNPWTLAATALAIVIPFILKGVKALGGWGVVWAYIVAGAKSGWAYFKGFFQAMWGGVKWIGQVWWDYANLMVEIYKSVGLTAWDGMKALVGIMGDAGMTIANIFKDVGKGIFKAITFQFDDMKEAFGDVANTVAEGWNSAVDRVDQIGEGRFSAVGDKFGNLLGSAAGSGFLAEWNSSMGEAGDATAKAMAEAKEKMNAALSENIKVNVPDSVAGPTAGSGSEAENIATTNTEILEARKAFNAAVLAEDQTNAEYAKAIEKDKRDSYQELWGGYYGGLVSLAQDTLTTMTTDILNATGSMTETIDKAFQTLGKSLVAMSVKSAVSWAASRVKMAIADSLYAKKKTITQLAAEKAAIAGMASTAAAAKALDKAQTSGASGAATAKYHSAYAGIPFAGPALASGFVAKMMAEIAASKAAGLAFADGGLVPGSGSGRADDRDVRVSSGEYIVKKDAVDFYGSSFMNDINGKRAGQFDGGNSLVVNLNGGGSDISQDEIEELLVPLLERLGSRGRLSFG